MPKIAATLLAAVVTFACAPTAHADGVAFWGYWQAREGRWTFATTGPAQARPKDGAVEGWRFAMSTGNDGVPPRDRATFADVCPGLGTSAGHKRVAVVIDFGDAADAPKGQRPPRAERHCATVPERATGSDVLAAAARAQTDKSGMICAIDAFGPCGVPGLSSPTPSGTLGTRVSGPGEKNGASTGLYAGIGLVVVVAAVGGVVAMRRRPRG